MAVGQIPFMRSSGGAPASDFDSSDYRQNTYGAPDHYVDPTRSLASAGAGTLGDPWDVNQAMSEPVAGDVIGWLPGQSVILAHSTDTQTPTFMPANSGSAGNRIVHVTKYAAVALTAGHANCTQLRHDGTGVHADGPSSESGSGASMYGSEGQDYITYDGFYVDIDAAEIASDTGCISIRECTDVTVCNFYIKSKLLECNSNAVLYRPNNSVNTILTNFICEDHSNDGSGGTTPQEGLFSDQYGDQNYLIEYGTIRNCESGIFPKGTAVGGTVFNYGEIRYNLMHGVNQGMRFNDCHGSNVTTVHHNLIYDYTGVGITFGAETTSTRNILIHHNTIANGSATSGGANGGLYIRSSNSNLGSSNVIIRDNIFDWVSASGGRGIEAGEHTETMPTLNYNRYYRGANTVQWSYNSTDYSTIASWRTATGQEANSNIFTAGDDPFNNRAGDDYTIAAAHAALTSDTVGGESGAYEGNETPGHFGSY